MRVTAILCLLGTVFFGALALIYGILTEGEPVGTAAIAMVGGLSAIIGVYLWILDRRLGRVPEDDRDAEIDEGAGELGVFAPWSWWPLVLAAAAAICFLGLAIGYWLLVPGAMISIVALVGWTYEFSRGTHAH